MDEQAVELGVVGDLDGRPIVWSSFQDTGASIDVDQGHERAVDLDGAPSRVPAGTAHIWRPSRRLGPGHSTITTSSSQIRSTRSS